MSILLGAVLATAISVQASSPFLMSWSGESFGPDGPWHAVAVTIGTPAQSVALYPGGTWSSTILLSSICANKTISSTCYAPSDSLYTPDDSTSDNNVTNPGWGAIDAFSAPGYALDNVFYDRVGIGQDTFVPNVSMTGVYQAYQIYPDGTNYPVEVGTLSLGAPVLTHVYDVIMMFIPSWLYTSGGVKQTPSYSYGLHIGSVSQGIQGSLLLGGYDQNRVLGSVSTQSVVPFGTVPGGHLPIGLMDIGIGVATGGSPFQFQNKTGLLTQSNSSLITPLTVKVDPTRPYLYLPGSTCDAMASELPVIYQEKYGLYFWNTSDSAYETIVSSAAYLSFTFQKDSVNTASITINVPFALLNLTLEEPLATEPTPYFPCMPWDYGYMLGRAFLQAAFVGVNYGTGSGTGNWYLAQAPGPGVVDNPTTITINVDDTTIESSSSSWEESWNGYWHPLASNTSTSGSSSTATTSDTASNSAATSGLSVGAKAGIGVGCGAVALITAIVWAVYSLRRKRQQALGADSAVPVSQVHEMNAGTYRDNQQYGSESNPAEAFAPKYESPRYELAS